jgi:hypothetical protein
MEKQEYNLWFETQQNSKLLIVSILFLSNYLNFFYVFKNKIFQKSLTSRTTS